MQFTVYIFTSSHVVAFVYILGTGTYRLISLNHFDGDEKISQRSETPITLIITAHFGHITIIQNFIYIMLSHIIFHHSPSLKDGVTEKSERRAIGGS